MNEGMGALVGNARLFVEYGPLAPLESKVTSPTWAGSVESGWNVWLVVDVVLAVKASIVNNKAPKADETVWRDLVCSCANSSVTKETASMTSISMRAMTANKRMLGSENPRRIRRRHAGMRMSPLSAARRAAS
jgi:hypothetical protein